MCIRIIILYNFVVYKGILGPLDQGKACFQVKKTTSAYIICLKYFTDY